MIKMKNVLREKRARLFTKFFLVWPKDASYSSCSYDAVDHVANDQTQSTFVNGRER